MQGHKKKCFLLILFISVFIFSGSMLGWLHIKGAWEENSLKQLAQAKQQAECTEPPSTQPAPPILPGKTEEADPVMLKQYEALYQQNADMIGWIKIDGTEIDYPVMYTGDDFYLSHDFNQESAKSGIPFIDQRCTVDPFGTNTIVYAHNMKNGTMFSELLNYKSMEYYEAHPVIHFDTLYETKEYEIVAVFESEVYKKSDTVFKHYNFLNADTQADFEEYAANIEALSLYDTGIHLEYGDEILTLMTCSYHTENGRFVVVARTCA